MWLYWFLSALFVLVSSVSAYLCHSLDDLDGAVSAENFSLVALFAAFATLHPILVLPSMNWLSQNVPSSDNGILAFALFTAWLSMFMVLAFACHLPADIALKIKTKRDRVSCSG